MTIYFAVERGRDVVAEMRPLLMAHWDESEQIRPPGELNPDYERYFRLEEAGWAVVTTARREGELMGYSTWWINRCLWTQTCFAVPDLLYLKPEARRGWTAVRLVQYGHALLRHLGVSESRMYDCGSNTVQRLCEYLGYTRSGKTEWTMTL